jgi:GT2 family glycosyltransferase
VNSDVDVVIPTFRRPVALAACLESLERQTLPARSIEVVDDSETDQGPGKTRNIGWRRGSGKFVAFIDDDCIAPENWIEVIQSIMETESAGGIEGAMTTTNLAGERMDFNPPNRFKWDRFKTANMVVRRDALEQVGGFDERYYLHREDTDLAWRIIDAGHRMVWAPNCKVHHPEPIGIHGGVYGAYPRSEQLLYHCNPKKFVECAAGMISRTSVMNGDLRKLRREMRRLHEPGGVKALTRIQSFSLWTKAWSLAAFWVLRKATLGEPKKAFHFIE